MEIFWQWYGKWSDGTLPTYQSRRQYIAELLQPTIDALASGVKPQVPDSLVVAHNAAPAETLSRLDIFVSHSGADAGLARLLAELLRNALNLAPERIRCTSVDGYRLEVGADTNETLRIEVRQARAFIALLTRNSIASTYVLFEMGGFR
ncbi:MAG: TIR domain-containing protein [Verrucomicrobiales bacterium]